MTKIRCRNPIAAAIAALCLFGIARAVAEELVVAPESAVTVEYTLTLPDKTLVASSKDGEPIEYVHGRNEILAGLEKGLTGMKVGESRRIELAAEDAFGMYDEKARVSVDRDQLPPDVKEGAELIGSDGQQVVVVEVTEGKAVLDTNHPMAGKTVIFDVKVTKVAKAEPAPEPAADSPAELAPQPAPAPAVTKPEP